MAASSTRRQFLRTLAAGAAGYSLFPANSLSAVPDNERSSPRTGTTPAHGTAAEIDGQLRHRAAEQLRARRLVVDYYRIRRRVAYPLPVPSLLIPDIRVAELSNYPWATWMLWALEERMTTLGLAVQWLSDDAARRAVLADLAALAQWPQYRQYPQPDLSSAHAGRILWRASHWQWAGQETLQNVRRACARHVADLLPLSDRQFGSIRTHEDILHHKTPEALLHNIHVIGTVGAALTAAAAGHPADEVLNSRVEALLRATFVLRARGLSEGVAYDGYVLDFVADWLNILPEAQRAAILDHPGLKTYRDESYMLAAPGTAEQVAELGDVEPREMPFHLSALAKLQGLRRDPYAAWHLWRARLNWLRSDALAALRLLPADLATQTPLPGPLDAHYAAVLRTGWEADDLAVALSCTNSPAGHIPCDSGTLVLGTRGTWLISDPGYQQYAKGDEREFTVGPTAHNAPLINGLAQTQKRPRRLALENLGPGVQHVAVDLTACYPLGASAVSVVRHVWLLGKNLVVVGDQIQTKSLVPITYYWHGHPGAAWWVEANWAGITLDDVQLGMISPQVPVSLANLQKLPGSRGQTTLVANFDGTAPVAWWILALGDPPPEFQVLEEGRSLRLDDRTLRV
ncbi:Heparinase II/III family protein [Gammaproteobacteria bacterium]